MRSTYQTTRSVDPVAHLGRRGPDLGFGDMGCEGLLAQAWVERRKAHTQHRTLLVLDTPLLSDMACNAKEDDDIVLCCVLAWVKAPHNGKAPTLMNLTAGRIELGSQGRDGEGLARDAVWVKSTLCFTLDGDTRGRGAR